MKNRIPFGFDSCSAPKYEEAIRSMGFNTKAEKQLLSVSESCESSLFSAYINVKGEYWNCSFSEDDPKWKPVNVLEKKDFLEDVWNAPEVVEFRKALVGTVDQTGCRKCITYPEIND